MPQLPTYQAQKNIQVREAAPRLNEAERNAQIGENISSTMIEVAQKWSDANDVMEYNQATSIYEKGAAQIKAEADQDTGVSVDENGNTIFTDNTDKYVQRLNDLKKKSLSSIKNQSVASKASAEFDTSTAIDAIKIGASFKTKQLEINKVNLSDGIQGLVQQKLDAITPSEKMRIQGMIDERIALGLASGTIDPKEAAAIKKDANETGARYKIYEDNSINEEDSQVLKDLRDPKSDLSKMLDPETRLGLIKESQNRIFQNNQANKRINDESRDLRYDDIFSKMDNGQLFLSDIDEQMKIPEDKGGIPKKQLISIKSAIQSKIDSDLVIVSTNNDKAADYVEAITGYITNENDSYKAREYIVNAFKDQVLSPQEAKFMNALIAQTNDIKAVRSRDNFMGNKFIPFKNAINSVNDFFTGKKNFTESDKALAIKELISNMALGGEPKEAQDQAIRNAVIKKNPDILNFPKEGQPVMDDNGNIKLMFPDGTWKEYKQK